MLIICKSLSNRDRLSMPRGDHRCAGTSPMCGQESFVPPELLHSFLFSHQQLTIFFFAWVSLHILVLPFLPALFSISHTSQLFYPALPLPGSQNRLKHARLRSFRQSTSFHIPLPLFCTSLRFHTSHDCFALPSQNLFEHARSRSLL